MRLSVSPFEVLLLDHDRRARIFATSPTPTTATERNHMQTWSLDNKPLNLQTYRKKSTVDLVFITGPFNVETQEGQMTISPETVDDWDGGYYLAYPSDGSKPYAISPAFVRDNYVLAGEATAAAGT